MAKVTPTIYAIVPVYNRLNFTKECLISFFAQKYKNLDVILVDDGSTDGTSEYVSKHFPKVTIIHGDGSWWWTKCMYEGAKLALSKSKPGDYILEMNNDCYFGPGYLDQLIKTQKRFTKSIVGSLCVKAEHPKEVVEAGIRIEWKNGLVYGVAPALSTDLKYFQKMKIIDKLDALPGKGTLVPIEVFKEVGSYNYRKFPHYIADYEFINRAKRAGYNILVDPNAIVSHHWTATGITYKSVKTAFSYKNAWNAMFGRRSMSNIFDWLNFVFESCPRDLLLLNLYTTFWRTIYGATRVFPFIIFRPIVWVCPRIVAKIYHISQLPNILNRQLKNK